MHAKVLLSVISTSKKEKTLYLLSKERKNSTSKEDLRCEERCEEKNEETKTVVGETTRNHEQLLEKHNTELEAL